MVEAIAKITLTIAADAVQAPLYSPMDYTLTIATSAER